MRGDELTAAIEEVRARARARAPQGSFGLEGVSAPDVMPLVHARDAAEAKVAAIGTVNPRPGGLKNSIAQAMKRWIARALDWHVREQVEFNRGSMACVQATIEALVDLSRSMSALASHHRTLRQEVEAREARLREEFLIPLAGCQTEFQIAAEQLSDIRKHWTEWRTGFEENRSKGEIHLLRTISELQASFQHRVTLLDQNFREIARLQHADFTGEQDRRTLDVQERFRKDLEHVQGEMEKLVFTELRLLRQRPVSVEAAAPAAPVAAAPGRTAEVPIDWMRFGEVFRGSEERIREHQKLYAARFAGTALPILDLGCGRGEFLEAARDAGLAARGIELSEECVAFCRAKGLEAQRADLFEHLASLDDRSLGGVYCSQVIEHLPPERLPVLVRLIAAKLHTGGLAVFETPNPECLAIFATHFYIDPTHTRPVPARLMRFYMEEAGFINIEVDRLEPAVETMPSLSELPVAVRETFFGGLDYAISGRRV
ncbi:MAG TPA: class I SAM-dependent methyltransferase [Bryobacteraceae bacterium]